MIIDLDETGKWVETIDSGNLAYFLQNFSIDEQMVPYVFGQHFFKLFVRGKAFLSFLL